MVRGIRKTIRISHPWLLEHFAPFLEGRAFSREATRLMLLGLAADTAGQKDAGKGAQPPTAPRGAGSAPAASLQRRRGPAALRGAPQPPGPPVMGPPPVLHADAPPPSGPLPWAPGHASPGAGERPVTRRRLDLGWDEA